MIRFKSASVMLEMFGMANGGKEYRRLVAAFERIFGAIMFFGTDPAATARASTSSARRPSGTNANPAEITS